MMNYQIYLLLKNFNIQNFVLRCTGCVKLMGKNRYGTVVKLIHLSSSLPVMHLIPDPKCIHFNFKFIV